MGARRVTLGVMRPLDNASAEAQGLFHTAAEILRRIAPHATPENFGTDVFRALGVQAPNRQGTSGWCSWDLVRPDMWLEAHTRGASVLCWLVLLAEVVSRTSRRGDPRYTELLAQASLLIADETVVLHVLDERPGADALINWRMRPRHAE